MLFRSNGLPSAPTISSFLLSQDGFYYVTVYTKGVYRLAVTGSRWLAMNSGITNLNTRSLTMDKKGFLYVCGDNNMVCRSANLVTVVHTPQVSQSRFVLLQNYPNPFNPSTTISFSLTQESFVTLKIFDVSSREVATLVNEALSAGPYSIHWKPTGLASAVYFYTLQAGPNILTKKLVLLR